MNSNIILNLCPQLTRVTVPLRFFQSCGPFHAVTGQTPFRQNHAKMRRLTAHSERHHIADMTAAENMHMAAAGDTKITAVILVGQGETDPYAVRIRKDRFVNSSLLLTWAYS